MGRRRSLVGALLKDLERSARRAESERRKTQQRIEGVRLRALEREMVREERAQERAKLQHERLSERRSLLNEKQRQLLSWRTEVEDYVARDVASLRLANEGPEVEDRGGLFTELQSTRPYLAPDFEVPVLAADVESEIRARHESEALAAGSGFHHPVSTLNAVQAGVAGLSLLGGALTFLPASPSEVTYASVAALGLWATAELMRRARWNSAFDAHHAALAADAERRIEEERARRVEDATARAHAEHSARVAAEEEKHLEEQSRRIRHIEALLQGDAEAMEGELRELFPLELQPELPTAATLETARVLRLSLALKLDDALQPKVGTLLASGKPSFKMKTQKQLKAEAQRYIAGVALRHASEGMFFLPTVDEVRVEVSLDAMDSARGVPSVERVLEVSYDFATLGPLQMADIDPVEALSHFQHTWRMPFVEAAVKRMVGK